MAAEQRPVTHDAALPDQSYLAAIEHGGIKKVKSENRRSDAMSFIPPGKIKALPGFNVRVRDAAYEQHIRSLADSMKEPTGFRLDKPLHCFVQKEGDGSDSICIIDGHSRHEAVLLAIREGAQIDSIPVIFAPKSLSLEDMTVGLVNANNGRPLTTYETAIVVKRLANMGFDEPEIAPRLGFTVTHIDGLMLLASAPHAIAKLVIDGQVSASTAISEIRKHGPAKATARLVAAVEAATSRGEKKLTPANLPGARYAKAVKKSAPALVDHARSIRQDPGFLGLSQENQVALAELLDALDAAELADNPKGDPTAG